MTHEPQLQGEDRFGEFMAALEAARVRSVSVATFGTVEPIEVAGSWVLQPVVHVQFSFYEAVEESPDPLATEPFTWDIVQAFRSPREEREYVERVSRALSARGYSVVQKATSPLY